MTTEQPMELRRYHAAKKHKDQFQGLLSDAYRFVLPEHDPLGTQTAGQDKRRELYDDTACDAVDQRRARLHGQLFPPFREFMSFAPAGFTDLARTDASFLDAWGQDETMSQWRAYEAEARRKFHQAVEISNFHTEIDPTLIDVQISYGALLVREGTAGNPLRFEAAPVAQTVVEEGPSGRLENIYRTWSVKVTDIADRWPEAKVPPELTKRARDNPAATVDLLECCLARPDGGADYSLWWPEKAVKLWDTRFEVSPWIAFRMGKASGEHLGRGPVLRVLPAIKTANKVVELVLKNASVRITGMWQADDDGVINIQAIKLQPGIIIPKAPGSQGLQPLVGPGDIDLSQLILADLRKSIRMGILGPELPGNEDTTRRTAYEWTSRERTLEAVELPATLRLLNELADPLATRILHLLGRPSMAGSPYYIEPFKLGGNELRPIPVSPLIRLQDTVDADRAIRAIAELGSLFGPEIVGKKVDVMRFASWFLEYRGFPTELIQRDQPVSPQQEQQAAAQQMMDQIGAVGAQAAAQSFGKQLGGNLAAGLDPNGGAGASL